MSDIRMRLVRQAVFPDECTLRIYDQDNCLGTVKIQRSGLEHLMLPESRDHILIEQILKMLPSRRETICHAIDRDQNRIVAMELRGNACRLFIKKDESVPIRYGWIDIKEIIDILWGDDFFGDEIRWD